MFQAPPPRRILGGARPVAVATGPGKAGTNYDGSLDFARLAADWAGNVDTGFIVHSLWVNFDVLAGSDRILWQTTGALSRLRYNNTLGLLQFEAFTIPFSTIDIRSTGAPSVGGWHHILSSSDLTGAGAGVHHLYLDDVNVLSVSSAGTGPATVDLVDTAHEIGAAGVGGVGKLDGCLSEVWIDNTVAAGAIADFSIVGNRRLFIDAAGLPVDLGATGQIPTGSSPRVFAPDGDPSNNLGTGGNYVQQGPDGPCLTVPNP